MIHSENQNGLSVILRKRTPMFAIAWLLVVLAGCSPPSSSKIVGKWVIQDVEAVSKKVVDVKKSSALESKMSVRFERAGRLTTTTKIGDIDSKKTGTWKWLSYDPESDLMKIECSLQGQLTEHEIRFHGTETIEWIPPNMAGTTKKIRFVLSRD